MTPEEWAKTRQILLENLAHDPIGVDELCRWCHVSAVNGQAILLELELAWETVCLVCIRTANVLVNLTLFAKKRPHWTRRRVALHESRGGRITGQGQNHKPLSG